jgi:hypothetical protein
LHTFEHVKLEAVTMEKKAILNSCSDPSINAALKCNGHGQCKDWGDLSVGETPGLDRLSFCDCDSYWADPECMTQRKSQLTAFLLSLFLGVFGVDQFYLGWYTYGFFKLITLGGCGIAYLYDIVKIGSHPVSTRDNYMLSPDLPHYVFALVVISCSLLIGLITAVWSIYKEHIRRSHEILLLRLEMKENQERFNEDVALLEKDYSETQHPVGLRGFGGHTKPLHIPNPVSMGFEPEARMPPSMGPSNFAGYGATLGSTAPRHVAFTMPPAASRTFAPAATLPPVAIPTTATMPATTARVTSMPPTEYSVRSSPVLPAVAGLPRATTAGFVPVTTGAPVTSFPRATTAGSVRVTTGAPVTSAVASNIVPTNTTTTIGNVL